MKKLICAANWKMNKGPKETQEFFSQFLEVVPEDQQSHFIFFTPALNLYQAAQSLKSTSMNWGAQNIYFEDEGAFTGENSAKVLSEINAPMCLIGHSERRHVFNEPNEWMSKKLNTLHKWNITPMLCVGETLSEREGEQTETVIRNQLLSAIENTSAEAPLIVAYEPVWAIGTGKVATPEIAESAHQVLRNALREKWGEDRAQKISILYGGSVKAENAKALYEKENIDGFLVGGASLKVDSFYDIFLAAKGD